MSIKDLFGKRSNKIVTKEQADKLVDEVESHDYVSEVNKGKRKFIPKVDYSEPKNFAKYGSAEKYYEDTIEHIYGAYPYDGSDAEKNKWHRESSSLDSYIFDTRYPKAVGHVHLNSNPAIAQLVVESGSGTYTKYMQPQYIYIQGGPNKDKRVAEGDEYELSKQFPAKGGRANIWNEEYFRASNLGINPELGNSIELWYKLDDDSVISSNKAFCLFDVWNNLDHTDSNYVRIMVEVLPETGDDFTVTYKYGTGTEGVERQGLNISAETKGALGLDYLENWNHYAFTMKSTQDGISLCLYINGVIEDTKVVGNQIVSDIPQENYTAIINAYLTKPTLSSPDGITLGVGGVAGLYIDDFRFWKTERNGRDVGRNWFTNVSGGTNTDNSKYSTVDNVDIGVYYKFNEGILDEDKINPQDSIALDYSGRISNGTIQNYNLSVRKLTSAIDECALLNEKETPEPIIYPQHPEVVKLLEELRLTGNTYDMVNNASFYHTMPQWILEEDEGHSYKVRELTQALSSYFDHLHLQIEALTDLRSNDYQSLVGKADKPYYFAKSLLRSVGFDVADIFGEATILEELASRGETELFDLKIQEVKNVIYQNIYNNITHIYKTKGTERSFRNLIRCFGVDDELVKINLYADGVDYTLEGRRGYTSVKKNYADFNNVDRHEAVVYNKNYDGSSGVREYLAGPSVAQSSLMSTTLTAEVIFPKQLKPEHPAYYIKPFTEVSLFGTKEANVAGGVLVDHAETAANIGSFRVFAVKPDSESLHAKFKLVYTDADGDHELVTEEFKEIYDNTKWNISVRLRPIDAELGDYVAGASVNEYQIDFYGVSTTLDTVENEFKLTASYVGADVSKAQAMIQSDKLCYVGALRTDLAEEATELAKTDVKVTDLMYWFDYLTDEEIKIHSIDAANFGRLYPNDDAYAFFSELSDGTAADIRVPRKDTLALYWNFQNVTQSDGSGNFLVNDVSTGGSDYISESRYGWFTDLVGYRHQGQGDFKPELPYDNQVVNREYQYTARHKLPEVLSGDDMVEIRTQDDDIFVKGSKPINHFFAIEKSMSQVISTEMLSLFASIVEFNDLIGQPVNRYRMQYKSLEKFRSLFYERVENVPSFEKYVQFYKWIDSSLGLMLQQLIPASGNFSDSLRNMIENHVLERSKYWTKFPTLEKKQDPPEGTIRGIRELTYDWEHGHAPIGAPVNTKAISFDGISSGVFVEDSIERYRFTVDETAQSANAIPGQGDLPFTISAWIYLDGIPSTTNTIIGKVFNSISAREYFLYVTTTRQIGFALYDDWSGTGKQLRVFSPSSAPIAVNQWVHVVATYGANIVLEPEDGDPNTQEGIVSGDMKVYLNGSDSLGAPVHFDIGSENYEAMPAIRDDFSSLIIGNSHIANAPFNGMIADVAIFNKLFTAQEVAECYGNGTVIQMSEHSASDNLIGWWKMGDDLDGTGTGGLKNYAVDASPATLYNNAEIVDVDLLELPTQYTYEEDENCLWRNERATRDDALVSSGDNAVDSDRESIRGSAVRDILGQTKMVMVGTELVEQGKPTLFDTKTINTYEGSTYATRRLSKPYKLNIEKVNSISGGPNFSDSLVSSPNDTIRSSTEMGHHIEIDSTKSVKDNETCLDGYNIVGGHKGQKRRAQELKLIDDAGVETSIKGSLVYNSLYGAYPHDTSAEFTNFQHDSYGQDHEVPMQGPFTDQWVGGNQHRHIDLNTGVDDENNRPELYKIVSGNLIKHPYDVAGATNPAGVYEAARYTRDGMAKRPLNIENIKSSTEHPKLGNYTYDYEVVQTSGRSNNNRWLVRNPDATPDSIASTYIIGLYDYTLPTRGRTEHVFVERFSAPGSPSTLSRGSLDYQAEEFSPYNSMNFRNLRVRNHLNFWHKEHSMQFGYREDYIHGTPDDVIGSESNDFGGNTPRVASWHKNNRNAAIRMKLEGGAVYSERSYDNFFVGHQIPRSDWQYSWITASAIQPDYAGLIVLDDEHRDVVTATQFPFDHDSNPATSLLSAHPRHYGYVSEYPNATIDLAGRYGLQTSASYNSYQIDFSYGNTAIAEEINYDTQTIGSDCNACKSNFSEAPRVGIVESDNYLNALLLNRYGPYQGAGWKSLRNEQNPIVRALRKNNQISIQNRIGSSEPHSHEKFVEPSTTWNKPIYHIISEASDGVGTRVVHSYSNNLEGFANPKLTKRTGFVKRNEQFYDRLFDYYNPNDSKKVYDFIGLTYKEYVFPKHRNVGLHKVRSRRTWDYLTAEEKAETATGDLRVFWKDNFLSRVKDYNEDGNKIDAVNAIGYTRRINPISQYLNLDNDITEHLRYGRSFFSMDVFDVSIGDQGDYYRYLGDLQYTGKENYIAFITSTSHLAEQKRPNAQEIASNIGTIPSNPIVSQKDLGSQFQFNFDAKLKGKYDKEEQAAISQSLYGQDYIKANKSIFDKNILGGIKSVDIEKAALTWSLLEAQKTAPEPVVQLYYNPFSVKYEEDAWLYRTNRISGKNPWYNSYADFNLETKAMAQNYGIVAEFRISEHMDKYITEDGGDFQSSNYNILSLEGANYNSKEGENTRYSGKTRYNQSKKFFISYNERNTDESVTLDGLDYPVLGKEALEQIESKGAFANNAFSKEQEYVKYRRRNEIYAAGTQTVENSIPANLGKVGSTLLIGGVASWASEETDATGTGRHRYFSSGKDLTSDDETYKATVYREGSTHPEWIPVEPRSYGPTSSLKFNYTDGRGDYLEGNINEIYSGKGGLNFRKKMTQTTGDNPVYETATPFTFSLWAKPKGNEGCEVDGEYDGTIKGLITFGTYLKYDIGTLKQEVDIEQLTVFSNFPMPTEFNAEDALVEKYKNGMGLTIYVPSLYDEKQGVEANDVNLFHFFDVKGNPAVLPPRKWSQVVIQIIPAISTSPIKIKARLGEETLYGIHRGLLLDENYVNKAYNAVPVESGAGPWGRARYGYLNEENAIATSVYKLGKSKFTEKSRYIQAIDGLSVDNNSQYYFNGELMEFSLWQGVMSVDDIERLTELKQPTNILEDFINGEILGGYTLDGKLQEDFGNNSDVITFDGIGLGDGASTITYTPTDAGISLDASRSKFELLAWHRLGVYPEVTTDSVCQDWDDGFFDSYVHTDPVRFYDNIVEDHDSITDTATKRIRLKVNALKKLIPYRGFYPQDRTLQLAKLFADKMRNSIYVPSILHEEQALQAALQPFFAPGILYNSIKAGVAVDWPAFTNETGLEPSHILEEANNLPYKQEDMPNVDLVVRTNVAPNWYVNRKREYDATLTLSSYDAGSIESAEAELYSSYEELKQQQPKYFASVDTDGTPLEAAYSKRGYIILSEPNTRIPFEGMVALDSVLSSKNSSESELNESVETGDVAFKYFDLEISGWSAEGTVISLGQSEPVNGYDLEGYPDAKTLRQVERIATIKKIKIGDPNTASEDEFDVNVDFRRAPKFWTIPTLDSNPENTITLSELNEELAVKICRAINKRPDIHYVAVPGYTSWKWSDSYDPDTKKTDDHLATMMPVVHPEIFGIRYNDDTDILDNQPYDKLLEFVNMGENAFKTPASPEVPVIGNQKDGTWRIRIIYVGLPSLSLDMSEVDFKNTVHQDKTPNAKSLMVKPFGDENQEYNPADLSTWKTTIYPQNSNGTFSVGTKTGINWKEAHIVCPFDFKNDPVPETPVSEGGVPTYWNKPSALGLGVSGLPHSFFEGGTWIIRDSFDGTLSQEYAAALGKPTQSLADFAKVWIRRDTEILDESRWIAGYGWFGYPSYGVNSKMGISFVDSNGVTLKRNLFVQRDINTPTIVTEEMNLDILKGNLVESQYTEQGPFHLYGGVKVNEAVDKIRVSPQPHKIYLMAPEYYLENNLAGDDSFDSSKALLSYKYPYFEYVHSDGDPRFEMAMHNFLAEVPNFFLKQGKLTSFVSKQEKEFKTMEAGKTYYMDITMHKSDGFSTSVSPHSFGASTMEGRYYGPAFKWQSDEDYENAQDLDKALIGDPAQAPYVPPYMYGKSIARLYFECVDTRKYSLEEILAGIKVENLSPEQQNKFINAGASLKGLLNSPAWNARTTISSSMNLFGKTTSKNIEYSAQSDNLFDDKNEELQKFVPQIAKDPEGSDNDIWTIETKFECPILNFYTNDNRFQMITRKYKPEDALVQTTTPTGTGIWAGYGLVPEIDEGVFVTVEDTFKQSESFGVPKNGSVGSLIDVCGFKSEKKKIGEIAEQKEISEAVVMIPFVDTPSDTTAETILVDGRNFFKINKDLFNLQKSNIENGRSAISAGEYIGVEQDIPETSISKMIRGMKKYNLPPRYDFVRYPLKKSQSPFVMYIFEFHHILNQQDLSNIWQGLPPELATTAIHDSATLVHDLSSVDFFEENNLPKNVRWMVFKVKKRANENYFASTSSSTDDERFEFNFEFGKMPPKYNYNWPYDFFTMLETVQVEAGLDIIENKVATVPQVESNQGEVSTKNIATEISTAKKLTER